jgi:SAM-dependent methyltransferase
MAEEAIKLNIGAGDQELPGFTPIDRKGGKEAYPLANYADGSVDEIRAVHVLEHFPRQDVPKVLGEWARVLRPGGRIRVAVPDMKWCLQQYAAGIPVDIEGFLMGGQQDADDFHHALFDEPGLIEMMRTVRLIRPRKWVSEENDCASQAVSLNIEAVRAPADFHFPRTAAILSVGRFGYSDYHDCVTQVLYPMGITWVSAKGADWGRTLETGIKKLLAAKPDTEIILVNDWDTLYTRETVKQIGRLAAEYPEYSAIVPLQAKRIDGKIMFKPTNWKLEDGNTFSMADMEPELVPIVSGHFGCTALRVEALKTIPHPWFFAQPNKDGLWEEGSTDVDIHFWNQFAKAGHKAALATRVSVGHINEMVAWPTEDLGVTYQHLSDFASHGQPREARQ